MPKEKVKPSRRFYYQFITQRGEGLFFETQELLAF